MAEQRIAEALHARGLWPVVVGAEYEMRFVEDFPAAFKVRKVTPKWIYLDCHQRWTPEQWVAYAASGQVVRIREGE